MSRARNFPTTYLREATVTYRAVKELPRVGHDARALQSSEDVYRMLGPLLARRITESLMVLALSTRGTMIGFHEVARGSSNQVAVSPCDVFRFPLLAGSTAIILAHNHPSGSPEPSSDDVALTRNLVAAGQLLGIKVLDHVVIAAGGYFSLLDAGLMRCPDAARDDPRRTPQTDVA